MANQDTFNTPTQDNMSTSVVLEGPRWASMQHQSPVFRSTLAAAAAFEDQVVLNQRQQQHLDALEKASVPSPHAYGRDQGGMQWGRRLTPQEILDEDIELDQKAWLFTLKRFIYPDKDFDAEDDLVQAESSVPEHQPQTAGHAASRDILPDSVLSLIKYRRMFNQAFQKICQHWLNDFGRDVAALRLTSVQKRLLPVIVMMLKDLTSDEITRTVEIANCRKVQGELPQTAIEELLMPFIDQSKSPELRLAQLHELVLLSNIVKQDQASAAFQEAHQYARRFTSSLSCVRREHPAFMSLLARLDPHEAKWMKQNPYQVSRVESVMLNAAASSPVTPASAESLNTCATWFAQQAYPHQPLPMFVTPNCVSQAEEGAEKMPPGYRGLSKDSTSTAETTQVDSPEQSVKTPMPFPCYPTGG
jgi:hypothetical protein